MKSLLILILFLVTFTVGAAVNQYHGTFTGDGSGLTNTPWFIVTTNTYLTSSTQTVLITAAGTMTANKYIGAPVSANFTDFTLTGTSVNISPTNGNLQSWVMSGASTAAMDAANTNFTESIRLNIYGSNTLTWTTTYLSNSAVLGPSNAVSVLLFDHARNTNLWKGYRLQ